MGTGGAEGAVAGFPVPTLPLRPFVGHDLHPARGGAIKGRKDKPE